MGKTAIIYATKTKHSKKLAEEIGQTLKIKAENIADQPEVKDVDLLLIVGGIYGGESLPELLQFVGSLDGAQVKKAALITSCVSKRFKQDKVRALLQQKGIVVVDEIVCRGGLLLAFVGHPNGQDIAEVTAFASRIMESANA